MSIKKYGLRKGAIDDKGNTLPLWTIYDMKSFNGIEQVFVGTMFFSIEFKDGSEMEFWYD